MKVNRKGIGGRKPLPAGMKRSERFMIFFSPTELEAIRRKAGRDEPVQFWRRVMLEQSGVS